MKILLSSVLALTCLAGAVSTVVGADDDLAQKRDAKLAEEWLKKADWLTDYDKALAEAKATGKPIFGYFTRSYAH